MAETSPAETTLPAQAYEEADSTPVHKNGDAVLASAPDSIDRELSFQTKVTPKALPRPSDGEHDAFAAQLERQLRTEERMRTERALEPQFKIQDLIRNPDLAAAAWQEMAGANEPEQEEPQPVTTLAMPANAGGIAGLLVPSPGKASAHTTPRAPDRIGKGAVSLMRDRSVLESIQADADAEFRINADISRLLISRLKAGRMALENLSEFVSTLSDAESAAAQILTAHRPPTLHCEGDPHPLHQVAAVATGLPIALSEPRRAASERLCGAASEIASAIAKFRSAADALERACVVLNGMAGKRRAALGRAMAAHEAACNEADRIDEMQRRGQAVGALEADPWETHAGLTAAERNLLGNLRTQRGVVMQANEQVERLERSRMACWCRLVAALLQTYAPHSGIPTGGMFKPLEQLHHFKDTIEWESLTDPMARAVEEGRATAHNMQRQAQETVDSLGRDLFSSSEIVRQGTLDRWHAPTAQWGTYHVVLTRRGTLHFLRAPNVDACVPVATVGVRTLDFDGVAGPAFALQRQQSVFQWLAGRSTKLVLRAADGGEATQWIVDLKEQMALWSGRTHVPSPAQRRSASELAV
eukprot:jgi/Ulvmu1/10298/UM060_0100.1